MNTHFPVGPHILYIWITYNTNVHKQLHHFLDNNYVVFLFKNRGTTFWHKLTLFLTHIQIISHQIIPKNLTLPPELVNTMKEIFINKNTIPIFHPGTYKVNTLGVIAICVLAIFVIRLIIGIKVCCCPQTDICQGFKSLCKCTANPTPVQQDKKTTTSSPKKYRTVKYHAQNQMVHLPPAF